MPRKRRPYRFTPNHVEYNEDGTALIVCRYGRTILVDTPDVPELLGLKWRVHRTGYAMSTHKETYQTILMHRLLTGYALVDHINGRRADNRRCNLREATPQRNAANRGRGSKGNPAKGVYRTKQGKFLASIAGAYIGTFSTLEAAKAAYTAMEREWYGEVAEENRAG